MAIVLVAFVPSCMVNVRVALGECLCSKCLPICCQFDALTRCHGALHLDELMGSHAMCLLLGMPRMFALHCSFISFAVLTLWPFAAGGHDRRWQAVHMPQPRNRAFRLKSASMRPDTLTWRIYTAEPASHSSDGLFRPSDGRFTAVLSQTRTEFCRGVREADPPHPVLITPDVRWR